jgi:hypothetical protein
MTFPTSINRLAFEFFRGDMPTDPILLTLVSGGQTVETIAFAVREPPGVFYFYGIESEASFDQAILRGPGFTRQIFLDNVRFESAAVSAIPEPTTISLLGIGALGCAGYCWRRRRTAC